MLLWFSSFQDNHKFSPSAFQLWAISPIPLSKYVLYKTGQKPWVLSNKYPIFKYIIINPFINILYTPPRKHNPHAHTHTPPPLTHACTHKRCQGNFCQSCSSKQIWRNSELENESDDNVPSWACFQNSWCTYMQKYNKQF